MQGGYEKCKKSTKSERAMHAKAACERIVFLYVLKNAINLRRKLSHVNGGYKRALCVCVYVRCISEIAKASGTQHTSTPVGHATHSISVSISSVCRCNDFNNMKIFKWKRFIAGR